MSVTSSYTSDLLCPLSQSKLKNQKTSGVINTTQQHWVQELNSAYQTSLWHHTSQLWAPNVLFLSLHTQPTVEVFQPNRKWHSQGAGRAPRPLCWDNLLTEIVNISSRQWNHKTTSPPGAGAAVGAGKVVRQYLLQSEISDLEISFVFQNTVIQMQAFSCNLFNLRGEPSWTAETPPGNHLSTKSNAHCHNQLRH